RGARFGAECAERPVRAFGAERVVDLFNDHAERVPVASGRWLRGRGSQPKTSPPPMILRIDRLPVDLPRPSAPNANAASAVQELLGGKFGEMSTLMNYTFQSFNFRNRTQ